MNKPLKIHTTKYLAAARLLSALEHGALLSIMINVFDVSGRTDIIDDDLRLSQLAGVPLPAWLRMKGNICEVMVRVGDRWSFDHLLATHKGRVKI